MQDTPDDRNLTNDLATNLLETLPGTEHSRYLIPIEYLPSRNFAPRWGHGKPAQAGLLAMIERNNRDYADVIDEILSLEPYLSRIPRDFSESALPAPAWLGVPISPIDTATLYAFMCRLNPRTYLEVGSGITTCFARRAIEDHGLRTRLISIDPEPRAQIDNICDAVVRVGLEESDLAAFSELEDGDVVFIDGTHRSFMNSDVTTFMIDVLPNLPPGVVVHLHDIILPYDYPDSFKHWYWNEQYLLASYLLGARDRIRILFPSAYVTTSGVFADKFRRPFAEADLEQGGWYGGGSMWLTHRPTV